MTAEEAIEILQEWNKDLALMDDEKEGIECHEIAMKALELYEKLNDEMAKRNVTPEHIIEYMKFEDECVEKGFTFNSLIEAREKQIAKKPEYIAYGYADGELAYDTWVCPNCETYYEIDYDDYDFCPNCGQKLDRSEEE